jgi:hypothetical protein
MFVIRGVTVLPHFCVWQSPRASQGQRKEDTLLRCLPLGSTSSKKQMGAEGTPITWQAMQVRATETDLSQDDIKKITTIMEEF